MTHDWTSFALAGGLMLGAAAYVWRRKRVYASALDHVARTFRGTFVPAAREVRGDVDGRDFRLEIRSKTRSGGGDSESMLLQVDLSTHLGTYLGPKRRRPRAQLAHDYSAAAPEVGELDVAGLTLQCEGVSAALRRRLSSDADLAAHVRTLVDAGGRVEGAVIRLQPRTFTGMVASGAELVRLVRLCATVAAALETAATETGTLDGRA